MYVARLHHVLTDATIVHKNGTNELKTTPSSRFCPAHSIYWAHPAYKRTNRLQTATFPQQNGDHMNRRQFLQQAAVASIVLPGTALQPQPAHAATPTADRPGRQAGYYWLQLGNVQVAAVSDGTLRSSARLLSEHQDKVADALKNAYVTSPRSTSVNAFLILASDRRILVDAGSGKLLGPSVNKIVRSLQNGGFGPADITDILLTHIHGDHSGGLTVEGKRIFPAATVHVNRVEADFWLSQANMDNSPEYFRPMFVKGRESLAPYLSAAKLSTFEAGQTVLPGITAVAAPGHTPGHTCYMLESQGEKLLFWGDTVHVAEAQFPLPDTAIEYDLDPQAAISQRQKLFAQAAEKGHLVAGAHISFPGIGHVGKAAQGYQWFPIPYVNDAVDQ